MQSEVNFVGASVSEGIFHIKPHLWKAWVLDPDIGLPLVFYFAKKDMKTAKELKECAVSNSPLESFDGVVPDLLKIEGVLGDNKAKALVRAYDEELNGQPATRIVLKHERSIGRKGDRSAEKDCGQEESNGGRLVRVRDVRVFVLAGQARSAPAVAGGKIGAGQVSFAV